MADHFGGGGAGGGTMPVGARWREAALAAAAAAKADPDRPRSKDEVMKEIVAKSKLMKYERQQAKTENENLINTLDDQFSNIRSLMDFRPPKSVAGAAKEEFDEFDRKARELSFDAKMRASYRTTTEE